MAEVITCSGCDNTWTGASRCHCSNCHITLSGIGLFDKHRHGRGERGGCLDPAQMLIRTGPRAGQPVMYLRDGIWSAPEMDEDARARRAGAA